MTIEEIGSLGEAIGAAAVVVSLIYLAIQLRQNTLSVRSATHQAILGSAAACNVTLTQNRELARILRLGSESQESLDPDERIQFSFLCAQFFDIFENLFLQRAHGCLEDEFWLPRSHSYLGLLEMPGFARYWDTRRLDYSERFRNFVDREVTRVNHGEERSRARLFFEVTEDEAAPV